MTDTNPMPTPPPPTSTPPPPPTSPPARARRGFSLRPAVAWFKSLPPIQWMVEYFEQIIIVTIALVTVWAALLAFLQTWADSRESAYNRQSQALSMEAMGHDMTSRQRESYDFDLYTTWNEWDWRRLEALEADQEALAERSAEVAEMVVPLTPLLDETLPYFNTDTQYADTYSYHVDTNLITTTVLLEQRAFTIKTANAWGNKGDGYVTVLTVLAVALFLYGLSTTISGVVRYLFALAGSFLVVVCVLWTGILTIGRVPTIPLDAIAEYARGQGLYYQAASEEDYQEAAAAFDEALRFYPEYGNAYARRAAVALELGDYAAAADYNRKALENGRAGKDIYWELGWVLYLLGDYPASVEASRAAEVLDPGLTPIVMNIATALLAQGDTAAAMQEYERGLAIAADPQSELPASWSHVYLLETVDDLERLIAAADGQTGFSQEPHLDNVADRARLRADAEAAHQRIKEGIVAIEASGAPRMPSAEAALLPLRFGQYASYDGKLLGTETTFARGLMSLVIELPFEALPQGATLSRRVTREWSDEPGELEQLPTMAMDMVWEGESAGTLQHVVASPWPGRRGMRPGVYTVEYYVNGRLLQSGQFTIPEADTFIVGAPVIATAFNSNTEPSAPHEVFPAGVAELHGQFAYSGLSDAIIVGRWYRDEELYEELVTNPLSGWGTYSFFLREPPAGDYRLELLLDDTEALLHATEFVVLDATSYQAQAGALPEESAYYRNLGESYLFDEDYGSATVAFAHAVDLDPECAPCYYQWGLALRELSSNDEAADKLRMAVELRPTEYDYRCELGDLYYEMGDDEAALKQYRAAVPDSPGYVFNRWGNALYDQRRYEEAAGKYQQAIDLLPGMAVYHSNLGGAYEKAGIYDRAEIAFAQAVALAPDNDWYYNRWGDTLYAQEKYAEALEKYRQAADIDPVFAPYFSDLGDTYYALGDYDEAIAAAQQAVELIPDRARDYNLWGDALYEQAEYAAAAEKYQQAFELDPEEALYIYNLGWAYYQKDQLDQARDAFEQAVALAKESGDTALQQDAEEILEEIGNP